jgi:hypothetical protein
MVELLETVVGYGPAHNGLAFNPTLDHLAYKLQGIKMHAKVQVGLWKGLLNWDDSELVADHPGDATDKALQVTEARLKKQLCDVMAVRNQRLGPQTSPLAASGPPSAASGPPPAAAPTVRVTVKRGRLALHGEGESDGEGDGLQMNGEGDGEDKDMLIDLT